MPTHRDPRIGPDFDYSFVEPVPLPIPSQKGLKIQARSAVVYNPALPSRDDVRRENYSRRLQQSQQQGFSSVNFKPYKGIGDPFYLDQKKLILHALGQWQEVSGLEGSGLEGSGPEGHGPEGRCPDGSEPEASGPEGSGPERSEPEGSGPEGSGPRREWAGGE